MRNVFNTPLLEDGLSATFPSSSQCLFGEWGTERSALACAVVPPFPRYQDHRGTNGLGGSAAAVDNL